MSIPKQDERTPDAYLIEAPGGNWLQFTPEVAEADKPLVRVKPLYAYTSTEALPSLGELTSEGPIFAEDRFGRKLSAAADAYLEEYVYSPEEFVADHEPTEFEYQLLADFIGGLFSDKAFSEILHSLIEKRTVLASTEALRSALARSDPRNARRSKPLMTETSAAQEERNNSQ